VPLPTYPFERRSFWIPTADPEPRRLPTRGANAHPLLGGRLPTAVAIFERVLTPDAVPYLAEHRLHGAVLVAGPVFLEMAQAAAIEAMGPATRAVEEFVICEPLVLPAAGRVVQVHLGDTRGGSVPFSVHSRIVDGDGDWLLHATGRLVVSARVLEVSGADCGAMAALEQELGLSGSCASFYDRLAGLGIQLGPSFRSLREARRRDGEALAAIALPPDRAGDVVSWVHPSLLDGAFQTVGLAVPESPDTGDLYLLTSVERIELVGALPSDLLCHARIQSPGASRPSEWRADVTLLTHGGDVVGVILGVCLRRASREALALAVGAAAAGGLFYQVAWEPAPPIIPAAASLEEPRRFVPRVRERFTSLAVANGLRSEQLLPELDRLCSGHLAAALHQMGFDASVGRVFTAGEEAGRLGVAERHARLFARLLSMLAEDGVLEPRSDGFEVVGALATPDPEARYEALLTRFGETDAELRTLRRCGRELARVLRGEEDPLHLLFPDGSFSEAQKLYVESPYARTYNAALGEALKAAIAALPDGVHLRVLEIGAGTGGTTSFVLPLLPADRVEYTFTDLSPLFLERAAEQFAAYPFLRRALLDIERDPLEQGFEAGRYDVVIAANVLHATGICGRPSGTPGSSSPPAACSCCSRAWLPSVGLI
jgi:acyl transferase domain-containing protein